MIFLNKKIIDFKDDALGLSIEDDKLRIVRIEDNKIKSFNSVSIPEGVIVDGEIINKDEFFKVLDKLIKGARPKKIKTKKVRLALSESKSFLRLISMPSMSEKELNEAIKWEIEANIPLSLDQVYYDWQLVGDIFANDENGEVKVLVLAAAKRIADQYLDILEEFGLEVIGIESETTALTRSLLSEHSALKTSLIISVDKNKTSFIFAIQNIPCFASSIPISEKNIIGAIAKKFNISDEKAKEIEEKDGIGSFFEDDALFEAIKPILDGLVNETKKTISFYLDGLKYSASIDRVIICGKMSQAKGLIPYLSRNLEIEVIQGDVREGMSSSVKDIPIIEKDKAIKYATAIGLALGNK
ncbi:MAG: pilus assembly protein PilM [Parcubacteria group bacterium]|jgi:type IV pilus assembly protein PilM